MIFQFIIAQEKPAEVQILIRKCARAIRETRKLVRIRETAVRSHEFVIHERAHVGQKSVRRSL